MDKYLCCKLYWTNNKISYTGLYWANIFNSAPYSPNYIFWQSNNTRKKYETTQPCHKARWTKQWMEGKSKELPTWDKYNQTADILWFFCWFKVSDTSHSRSSGKWDNIPGYKPPAILSHYKQCMTKQHTAFAWKSSQLQPHKCSNKKM